MDGELSLHTYFPLCFRLVFSLSLSLRFIDSVLRSAYPAVHADNEHEKAVSFLLKRYHVLPDSVCHSAYPTAHISYEPGNAEGFLSYVGGHYDQARTGSGVLDMLDRRRYIGEFMDDHMEG